MVKYSDLAAEAFREIDPEASYVFVGGRDSAGYPAFFKSEDRARLEASALWPRMLK